MKNRRPFFVLMVCFVGLLLALPPAAAHGQVAADRADKRKKYTYHSYVPEPTLSAVAYSERHRNQLDFWRAPSDTPTPVVISIHGGGFNGGSKEQVGSFVDPRALLDAGISVVAINYRFIKHCKDLDPPVQGPMTDGARAVQFVRSKAAEWNLDPQRIGLTGGSAGACTSLWIAYHDDLADPASDDPVARQSTRVAAVAAIRAQTTLDPRQMKNWIPNSKYGAHAFGLDSFDDFLMASLDIQEKIDAYSPYAHLTPDDPATFLYYPIVPGDGKPERDPTHSATFGVRLLQKAENVGVYCELVHPEIKDPPHATATEFLMATLKGA